MPLNVQVAGKLPHVGEGERQGEQDGDNERQPDGGQDGPGAGGERRLALHGGAVAGLGHDGTTSTVGSAPRNWAVEFAVGLQYLHGGIRAEELEPHSELDCPVEVEPVEVLPLRPGGEAVAEGDQLEFVVQVVHVRPGYPVVADGDAVRFHVPPVFPETPPQVPGLAWLDGARTELQDVDVALVVDGGQTV